MYLDLKIAFPLSFWLFAKRTCRAEPVFAEGDPMISHPLTRACLVRPPQQAPIETAITWVLPFIHDGWPHPQ